MVKPTTPTLQQRGKEIRAKSLTFAKDSAEISPAAAQSVAELADMLLRAPALRIRIQADGGEALALTRALVIKQRLIDAGVADAQVDAASEPAPRVTITIVE